MAELVSMHQHLPRLAAEFYRGRAWVHWNMAIPDRATGWLDQTFHDAFQRTLAHTGTERDIGCLAYCLMPDDVRLLTCGLAADADQRLFLRAIRRQLGPALHPVTWQKESYNNILRERERDEGALLTVAHYITNNPVRAGLAEHANAWDFRGAWLPDTGWMDPCAEDFGAVFWTAYNRLVERS